MLKIMVFVHEISLALDMTERRQSNVKSTDVFSVFTIALLNT